MSYQAITRISEYDSFRQRGVKLSYLQLYQEGVEYFWKAPLSELRPLVYLYTYPPISKFSAQSKASVRYLNIYLQRMYEMARGKSKPKDKMPNNIQFVSIRLSDDDKAALAELPDMTAYEFSTLVDHFVGNGYKLSVGMQANGSVNMTATCRDSESDNYNLALSGWGNSVLTAAMSLRYKHFTMAEEDWSDFAGDESSIAPPKFG